MKMISMSDGLFLYKSSDGFVVMDENDNILKLSKAYQTCIRYILKTLHSRRVAEREAIEEIDKSKV